MAGDSIPPFSKLTYWSFGGLLGVLTVGGLWLEVSDAAVNSGPGYIVAGFSIIVFVMGLVVAALDDERHPPKKDD